MYKIGITQRIDVEVNYGERRDCLDQRWSDLALKLGHLPVPIPNIAAEKASTLIDALQINALILSGGNSIASLNTNAADSAPERDELENALISVALTKNLPIIGICRGMQVLNLYMGGGLQKVHGHVAVRHHINSISTEYLLPKEVNSYHNYGIPKSELADTLTPLAYDNEGNIEAFYRTDMSMLGIMWHPEREKKFNQSDIQLLKRFLQ